jgi:hypothetical protein
MKSATTLVSLMKKLKSGKKKIIYCIDVKHRATVMP